MDISSNIFDRAMRRLAEAEEDLRKDVEAQQQRWRYRVHRGRVTFEHETRRVHRRLRQSVRAFVAGGSLRNLLTTPIIYSLLVPLLLLDLWVTLYQWVCFPIYGIERVPRRRYTWLDRGRLAYLNVIEKANCTYCSYATGLIAYVQEVAARTEQYWCPIKHAEAVPSPHSRYHRFVDYGDAVGYREGLPSLRAALRPRADARESDGGAATVRSGSPPAV